MKNIFILDEYITSQTNGIGKFINEFIYCFKNSSYIIYHIEFNSDQKELKFKENNKIMRIFFPCINTRPFVYYPKTVTRILRLNFEDSINNIFIINHSPCSDLLIKIKQWFPLSKLVFIVHDLYWINALKGNSEILKKKLSLRKKRITQNDKITIDRFEEEREIFKIADSIVCLCEDSKKILSEIYQLPLHKINLIKNGLRDNLKLISEYRKNEILKKSYCYCDEKIIIYVGRINESKGAYLLIKAFEIALKNYPNMRLVLIGAIQSENDFFRISHKIISKITITGHLSKKELDVWYSIADIGIIPSFYEQCSYAGIEMLMHGLSIVSTDAYGVRNMFDNKNSEIAGLSKAKRRIDKLNILSQAILNVVSSHSKAQELSLEARASYIKHYGIKYFKKKYRILVDNL